jgi:hypothetical protein
MMKKPIGQFRESLGLPKAYAVPSGTFLYGISEHFLAKPNDYPANAHFSGFWFGTSETALDAELLAFLVAGAPPWSSPSAACLLKVRLTCRMPSSS